MSFTMLEIYLISIGGFFLIINLILLVFIRKPIIEYVRRKFLIGKGYAYVRINDHNNHIAEYFMNIKYDRIKIDGRIYIPDPKKVRYKDRAPVYEFNIDDGICIDVREKDRLLDSEYLDGFLVKMKSLARSQTNQEIKMMFWIAIGCGILCVGAVIIGLVNYFKIDEVATLLGGII